MKTTLLSFGIIIAFVANSSFLLTSCSSGTATSEELATHEHMDNMEATIAEASFACPMHPEITGKEGEKCSKCGMNLVEVVKKAMDMDHAAACPMHPDVTGKEGDKCPKCGMALVVAENHDEHQQ